MIRSTSDKIVMKCYNNMKTKCEDLKQFVVSDVVAYGLWESSLLFLVLASDIMSRRLDVWAFLKILALTLDFEYITCV